MTYSELMQKLISGQQLSVNEQQELFFHVQRTEQINALVTSLIKPGTKTLVVDGLETQNARIDEAIISNAEITDAQITTVAIVDADITNATITDISLANDSISLESDGMTLANVAGVIRFKNAAGVVKMGIYANLNDALVITQDAIGKELVLSARMTDDEVFDFQMNEDPTQTKKGQANFSPGSNGVKVTLGGEIELHAQGNVGGRTYMRLAQTGTTPATPTAETNGVSPHIYVRNNKLIIQFEDGGTVRYKYLDLTGTSATWVHTTTAP